MTLVKNGPVKKGRDKDNHRNRHISISATDSGKIFDNCLAFIRIIHHASLSNHNYRPLRSCGKVMFSQASVILFTEVGCVYPSMHWGRHPDWLCFHRRLSFCSHGGVCIPACTGADTPWAETPGQTPPPTATAADGTHPTGMHSCLLKNLNIHYKISN